MQFLSRQTHTVQGDHVRTSKVLAAGNSEQKYIYQLQSPSYLYPNRKMLSYKMAKNIPTGRNIFQMGIK
jgi:hypothetical protein